MNGFWKIMVNNFYLLKEIKNDHDENPNGMGPTKSSLVFEISASTFDNSVNSKNSQKDKQSNKKNNNNDSSKKKRNIISYNIISVLRLLICYSMVLLKMGILLFTLF
jgi:hypothetical protein